MIDPSVCKCIEDKLKKVDLNSDMDFVQEVTSEQSNNVAHMI